MNIRMLALLGICLFTSCSISPEEINYNDDECAQCRMKISDSRFGAEIVTVKGKVYKYDSAECLFQALADIQNHDCKFVLVTDYLRPGTLVDAREATFLISPNRPSPMGGNLSAYAKPSDAKLARIRIGGALHDFQSMLEQYGVK